MDKNTKAQVLNRSQSTVIYKIPEKNIRREFAPNETKSIEFAEIEALTFQPGGRQLIAEYLLIKDDNIISEIGISAEPEYKMTKEDIVKMMKEGSLDAFTDCLNFAPEGVIDVIKSLAVSLPLSDSGKRDAVKTCTGFDVDAAIRHKKESEETEQASAEKVRLVTPVETGRKAEVPQYNVVTK